MNKISKQLQDLNDSILKVKNDLKEKIESLPINPNAKQLPGGALVISSAAIFGDKNMNMSPQHYDYKNQYKRLSSVIDSTAPNQVFDRLKKIMDDGFIQEKGYKFTFHPDVIKAVREVISQN